MTIRRRVLSCVMVLAMWGLAGSDAVSARQQDAASLLAASMTQAAAVSRVIDSDAPLSTTARRELLTSLDRVLVRLESVPRRYPRSRQANSALHEAASLADAAFQRFARESDRTTALRLYRWLIKEYPGSVHVRHATRRTAALAERARVAQTVGAGAPAPAPQPRSASAMPPATPASPALPPSPSMSAAPPPRVTPTLASATRARLTSITHQVTADGIRVVLTLDREVAFSEQRVADPDRLYIDLRTVRLDQPVEVPALPAGAAVSEIRTGTPSPDTARVVLTTRASSTTSLFTLYTPFRIVVDVSAPTVVPTADTAGRQPSGGIAPAVTPPPVSTPPAVPAAPPSAVVPQTSAMKAPAAATGAAPAEPAPGSNGYSLSRQLGLGVSHIVIDPGHGGKDPGASGHGVQESLLTLDVALRLERLLKKTPGIEVTLTRRTDEFVALEERTAIANRAHADLFLSIHANASRNPAANGVETYILSFAANPEAEAVAARENAASDGAMRQLPDMIRAIALNDKLDESRELAAVVQESMVTRLRRQHKTIRNLGVKKAPFVVLIGARMPSVLAEISFVTHKAEAQRLKTDAYKQRLAEALHEAVMRYRRALKQTGSPADTRNDQGR
jgi:N-acetylmuramoyl-L-alanine amidase